MTKKTYKYYQIIPLHGYTSLRLYCVLTGEQFTQQNLHCLLLLVVHVTLRLKLAIYDVQ